MEACRRHRFGSYWTSTESYTSLARYIQMDFGGLQGMVADLIAGERMPVNTLLFRNDMDDVQGADDVLTLLAHLGYLAYEEDSQTVRIPNEEVRLEFASTIRVGGNPVLAQMVADADRLLRYVYLDGTSPVPKRADALGCEVDASARAQLGNELPTDPLEAERDDFRLKRPFHRQPARTQVTHLKLALKRKHVGEPELEKSVADEVLPHLAACGICLRCRHAPHRIVLIIIVLL